MSKKKTDMTHIEYLDLVGIKQGLDSTIKQLTKERDELLRLIHIFNDSSKQSNIDSSTK